MTNSGIVGYFHTKDRKRAVLESVSKAVYGEHR